MIIEKPKPPLILPQHIIDEKTAEEKRKNDWEFVKHTRKMLKRMEKEREKGQSLTCQKCGVRAGTKTRLGDEYKGVTIRKVNDGYRCQLCQ